MQQKNFLNAYCFGSIFKATMKIIELVVKI